LTQCTEKKTEMWTQMDRNRVARCLKANGWKQYKAREGDRREWRFRR